MDVSGWTIDSKMKLPDHCFGNRELTNATRFNLNIGTWRYEIGTLALPDPACIWTVMFTSQPVNGGKSWCRIGLADNVPTNEAEMDDAVEILPHYGIPNVGPEVIYLISGVFMQFGFNLRKGIVTGGKKLVIALYCETPSLRVDVALLVSELPTKIPGWHGAWPAG